MGTVRVVLRKCRKLKDGRYPLAIRLTHNKKVKYIFTGHSALEREWNGKYPTYLNTQHPNQKELNQYLFQQYSKVNSQLLEYEQTGKPYTVYDLHAKTVNKTSPTTLFKFTEDLIDNLTKSGRIGNAENYRTALNVVKRFCNGKDIHFGDINYKWLTDFEAYHYSRGNSPVSLSVYFRSVRSLFNKAIKYGIIDESLYPFGRNKYSIPTGPSKKRAISKEDISKIEQIEFEENSPLWHAKNYFLFSFYTMGMNWNDMAHLKMKDIINDRIEYIRIKTKRKSDKAFSIKINPKIQSILYHYINVKENDDYIFPIIKRTGNPLTIREDIKNRLRRYNKNLERIGNHCGIEEKLTSYVSRHSWATIAKKSGIEIGIISDALGHQDTQVTRTYLDSFGSEEIDEANNRIIH
jgi:integrase/recombinase XerD